MHEHQIILMVLDAAGRKAEQIEQEGAAGVPQVDQMLDFFRNFADRCHHAKEEDLLFVKMEKRGVPVEGGPIGVMLREHDEGRRRLKAVADALPGATNEDPVALAAVSENLGAYTRLLRAHIGKEDKVLYPMADKLLTLQDQQELSEAFDRVETEEMGEGVHERYHQLAHELAG
jgi:hemerythrin-like domain-containing protein